MVVWLYKKNREENRKPILSSCHGVKNGNKIKENEGKPL